MAQIMDGKMLAQKIRNELKEEVAMLNENGIIPKLAVIMVGNNEASKVYVKNKSKACEDVGIKYEEYILPEETTNEELLNLINELNKRKEIHGILLQSPLPKHLDIDVAFEEIDYRKDVDGFHSTNVGNLVLGRDGFISCTPYGIIKILEEYDIKIQGKHAVVIGRSNIVGKPIAQCLLARNATVTMCHSKTQNLKKITEDADIIVAALGKPKFVKADMIKPGAVVIDVGINRMDNGKLCGDTDYDNLLEKAGYITPVPGGVGPMTVAMLMNNVVKAAKNLSK